MASEEYDKRETSLFGPGFLEKASKRLETKKTLARVSDQGRGRGLQAKKSQFANDKNDLLTKGAPAQHGSSRVHVQHCQPYSTFSHFQGPRYMYFQGFKFPKGGTPKPRAHSSPSSNVHDGMTILGTTYSSIPLSLLTRSHIYIYMYMYGLAYY